LAMCPMAKFHWEIAEISWDNMEIDGFVEGK
jgi:hypothetical protein